MQKRIKSFSDLQIESDIYTKAISENIAILPFVKDISIAEGLEFIDLIDKDLFTFFDKTVEGLIKNIKNPIQKTLFECYLSKNTTRSLYVNSEGVLFEAEQTNHPYISFLEQNLNESESESEIANFFGSKYGNNVYKLFEKDEEVPTEDELKIADNDDFKDAKADQPGWWARIKNWAKRMMKDGSLSLKNLLKIIADPVKTLFKGIKDYFVEAFEELYTTISGSAKKLAKTILDKDSENYKNVHRSEHFEGEKKWYEGLWDAIMGWVQKFAEMFTKSATSGVNKVVESKKLSIDDYDMFMVEYEKVLTDHGFMNEAEDKEAPHGMEVLHNMAKEDKSFMKKFDEIGDYLSNVSKMIVEKSINGAATIIEKVFGHKAVEGYPVTTAVVDSIANIAIAEITDYAPWNLSGKKLAMIGAKALFGAVKTAIAPIGSILYWVSKIVKYLFTAEHVIHSLKGAVSGGHH